MDVVEDGNYINAITEWCNSLIQSLLSVFFQTSVTFEHDGMTVYYNANSSGTGEGAYSSVFKATQAFTSEPVYALKRMLIQSDEMKRIATTEIDAFGKFKHRNIIKLVAHAWIQENGRKVVYLLFPFLVRGSLRDCTGVTDRNQRTLISVLAKFQSICEALNVLHTYEPAYVHQDIKLEV